MSQEPEYLIESDHLESVLEEAGPPPPVLVVQYRNRLMPWVLALGLMGIALGLGGMLARHRREAERLRAQMLQARSDLERLREQAQAEDTSPRPAPVERPGEVQLAMATSPGAAGPAGDRPATVPADTGKSAAPPAPDAPALGPAEAPPSAGAEKDASSPPASPDPAAATVRVAAKPVAAGIASAAPVTTAEPPITATPPQPAAPKHRIVTLPPVAGESSPFEEPPGTGGQGGPAPAQPAPVAPPAEPPLPSREETERQILEDAARMQRENNQRFDQQRQELVTLREDERHQFLDELRVALQVHGRKAGPQIEELAIRAGRDEDPVKLMMARRVLGAGRLSQPMKVRRLREIGVSESVILDYLANELEKDRNARNGPRSKNEVWIKAAQRLLSYELPPPRPGTVPPAPRQAAVAPVGRPAGPANRVP